MGLNICIERLPDRQRHPSWDWLRYGGDREIAALATKLPHLSKNVAEYPDYEWYIRPSDFSAWREAATSQEWPCEGRFDLMIDILEAEPDYWIYFSY